MVKYSLIFIGLKINYFPDMGEKKAGSILISGMSVFHLYSENRISFKKYYRIPVPPNAELGKFGL